MKVNVLVAAILALGSFGANAAGVTSLTITGGQFDMHTIGGNSAPVIGGATFTNFGTEDLALGGADIVDSTGTKLFNFFGAPTTVFTTAASASDITAGVLTLDVSTWTVGYTGNVIGQGPNAPTSNFAVTAFNPTTGAFTAHWFAPVPVAFPGFTGEWTVNGVAAVPEAETYAMMLAGLGLVGLVARRRKSAEI